MTILSTIFTAIAARLPASAQPGPLAFSPRWFSGDSASARENTLPDLSGAGHLLLPVTVFLVSLLSINLTHSARFVSMVWPANAIILVALLRHRPSLANYGSIVLGNGAAMILASLTAGNPLALALILTLADICEIAVAYALLRIFRIDGGNLTSFKNLILFIICAGGIAPLVGVLISAPAFASTFGLPLLGVWRNWYPNHALAMTIVAPLLISVTSDEWDRLRIKERPSEAIAIIALIVAIGVGAAYFRFIIFVMAPAILFATVRFGLIGATAATFVMTLMATVFVSAGIGQPAVNFPEISQRVFALQVLLAIISLWSLPTAALLMERDRLLDDLSQANSQLTAESERKSHLVSGLRRHLSAAEEKERLRLSHELHDQAGQTLIAAILELNEVDSLLDGAPRARLQSIRKRMEEMGKTLHRIAWELRPPSIDELGLRKALASYIGDWIERCGIDVDVDCDDPELDQVPGEIGTAVYRIVQEGLTNVVKHAGRPSTVSVVVRRRDTVLQVIIEDNGCGFDPAAALAKGHRGLGLDGMQERLALIGGTLEIESAPGGGTTIFARIAIDPQRPAA
jgi:signal transduction histidine kinase